MLVLRDRELLPRDDFAAPLLFRPPDELRDAELFAPPELDDLPRLEDDFAAPPDREALPRDPLPLLRDALERLLDARVPPDFFAVERDPDDLRPLLDLLELLRPELDELELPPLLEPSVGLHLPDMTRCAASATASAISEPNFVALAATLLAACDAVSAASRPASRIFLRAAGLAAIAAAAAVRPAASISLLIAALASLSTVLSFERERPDDADELEPDFEELEREREELLRADFAIFYLPPSGERHFRAVPVP